MRLVPLFISSKIKLRIQKLALQYIRIGYKLNLCIVSQEIEGRKNI